MADEAEQGGGAAKAGPGRDVTFTITIQAALAGAADALAQRIESARAEALEGGADEAGVEAAVAAAAASDFVPERQHQLRFSFNGENVQTEDVSSWEREEKVEGRERYSGVLRRYSHSFKSVKATRAWIEELHSDSQMTVFVGDRPSQAEPEEGKAEPLPARHYAGHAVLDLSVFLGNDTSLAVEFGEMAEGDDGTLGAPTLAIPPEGFAYLKLTVTSSEELLPPELQKSLNPMSITLKQAVDLPGVHMAEGDPSLRKYVTPTPYHLMREHCKPVYSCFKFFDGDAIPRVVRSPAVPYGRRAVWHTKTVFLVGLLDSDQLKELIREAPISLELHDRDTPDDPEEVAERHARWEGIIAGTYVDPAIAEARAQELAAAAELAAEEAEAEAEAGSAPLASARSRKSTARSGKSSQAAESAAAAEAEQEGAPTPQDVFVVDKMVAAELAQLVAKAGDSQAHATAALRLDPLLERGPERLQVRREGELRRQQRRDAQAAEKRNEKRMALWGREVARCKAAGKPVPGKPVLEEAPPELPPLPEDGDELMDLIAERLGGLRIKQSFDVVPAKRRFIPKGGVVSYDLSPEQRVTRQPGAYRILDTRLKVEVRLHRPVHTVPPHLEHAALPFERAVFCMPYGSAALLRAVWRVLQKVNCAAFPQVPSIKSHQLTPEQQAENEAGRLDVISGFQLIDAKWRIVVIEGLGDGGMREVHKMVSRTFANSPTTTYLANPKVRFRTRLYGGFHLTIKDVRLRDPLSLLVESPEIYDRAKVTGLTFAALYRLYELRNCSRINQVKTQKLFPTVPMLLEIENKYGDTVTVEDMTGRKQKKKARRTMRRTASAGATSASTGGLGATTRATTAATAGAAGTLAEGSSSSTLQQDSGTTVRFEDSVGEGEGGGEAGLGTSTRKSHADKLDVLDITNPAYDKMLEERKTKKTVNFVTMNRSQFQSSGGREKVTSKDVEGMEPPGGAVYNYSGQKRNFAEWQKELMRQRLAKDKKSTYTYSKDFQSLTVCLVNEAEMAQLEKAASKARWTTQRGFVYPAPKDPAEFRRHPQAPSASRKEELSQPWQENPTLAMAAAAEARVDDRPKFDTVPVRNKEFGYVGGDGKTRNPDFFKSVFLCGDGLAAEEAAAKKAAEEAWQAKVVVDNTRFTPHFTSKHPSQLHKLKGLLDGSPRHKGLRIVHKARLPSGKATAPPTAAPASIFTGQDYEDPVDFTTKMRPNNKEHFYGTNAAGEKVEFFTHIHKDANKPKSWKAQYTRKHPALGNAEKRGSKWFPDIHKKNSN